MITANHTNIVSQLINHSISHIQIVDAVEKGFREYGIDDDVNDDDTQLLFNTVCEMIEDGLENVKETPSYAIEEYITDELNKSK